MNGLRIAFHDAIGHPSTLRGASPGRLMAVRGAHRPQDRARPMTADQRFEGLERRELAGGLTILVARTRRARWRGLARLDALAPDHALLLERCRSVHTVGMRFALDLVWIDADGASVRLDPAVAPRRLRGCRHARAVIECSAGDGERFAAALAAGA
jgi:uncharacterized membrane protein (UPF0127 family)